MESRSAPRQWRSAVLFMVPSGSSHVTMVEEKQLEGWSSPANPAFVVTLPQSMTSAPRGALDEMKVVDILPFLKERETGQRTSKAPRSGDSPP